MNDIELIHGDCLVENIMRQIKKKLTLNCRIMKIFGKRKQREMLESKLSNLEYKIEQINHTLAQTTASLEEHISKMQQRNDDLYKLKESKLVDNENYALYLWFSEGGEGFADFENNTLTKTKKYYSESLIQQYLDKVLVNSHFDGCCRYSILDKEDKEVSQGGVLFSSKEWKKQ